ncbi:MAG: DUF4124 domain-containing protein [Pseudomonadota bacterium]
MATRTIFVFASLLCAGAAFAQAYKWTDENGVVHYSDRPEPGAEEVALPESATRRRSAPAASLRNSRSADEQQAEPETPFAYQSFAVANPGPEETLWNIEGTLSVSLDLQPGLRPGHQIRVYFDGQPRLVNGTSFQIEEVWRGVHNLQAEVLDETGKLMIRSQTNRFYVQQNTIL